MTDSQITASSDGWGQRWWHAESPEVDEAQMEALRRVLADSRAGAHSAIVDQVNVSYLLGKAVLALAHVASPQEYGGHGLMWQVAAPISALADDVPFVLDRWADICEERWDMYRRVQAVGRSELVGRYPADLLAGRRLATEEEARQLAAEDAAGLRAMAAAHRECFESTKGRLRMGHICQPDEPLNVPTALYFWYDARDVLLYIGITGDLAARQSSHAKKSSWAEFADHSKIQRFPNRPAAEAAEKAAIEAERPLFNHQHNDTPEARARLVAYLVEHGRMDLLAPAVSRG